MADKESKMPHARSACETLDDFVELHYPQLQILGVPQKYWPVLFNKLKNEVRISYDLFPARRMRIQNIV